MQKFAGVRPAEEAAGVWVRVSVWRIFMEFDGGCMIQVNWLE